MTETHQSPTSSDEDFSSPSLPKKRNTPKVSSACPRTDNSLGVLTNKLVELLKASSDYTMDLNDITTILKVQKRRLYDITNVLEGIGLIKKKDRGKIQ